MTDRERWLPVVGYEGYYEISDRGRVRSLDRCINRGDGYYRLQGVVLKHGRTVPGHHYVNLSKGNIQRNCRVHRLVLEAFVGPCPDDMHGGLHWDDDKDNNALSNLRWGTLSENQQDLLRNGKNSKASQTECQRGHPFTPDNILRHGRQQQRLCRTCRQAWRQARRRERKLARSAVSV